MRNRAILAGVWACLSVSLGFAQDPEEPFVTRPISPASVDSHNQAKPGILPSNIPSVGAGNGGTPVCDTISDPGLFETNRINGYRCWTSVDYLLWWLKPVCLKPPTLTLGSPADAVPGAVGQPHTQVFLGDHQFEFSGASGMHLEAGAYLTADQFLSFAVGGFLLEKAEASESFHSSNPLSLRSARRTSGRNSVLGEFAPFLLDAITHRTVT